MSIIYDALKKSQHARANKSQIAVAQRPRLTRKNVIITLLILTSLFVVAATITITNQHAKNAALSQKKVVPVKPIVAIAQAPRLMLEGVFLSENEKLAMINHHTYHEGDNVHGMQIVNIAFDQVTLKNNNRLIKLRSVLTQLD